MSPPQKVIVLEANEVPLRIFRRYAELHPGSAIARMLDKGIATETIADDVASDFLYPSQTWASLNSGASYDSHKIHWYNDAKPGDFPMYWRRLADAGRPIGLVGSLHAAPLSSFDNSNIQFLIPDCFAEDSSVKPAYFEAFQRFNLRASAGSARVAQVSAPARELLACAASMPRLGIRASSVLTSVATVTGALSGRINRERIRNLQFVLFADIFEGLVRKHDPDLAILFTNHVAANMHRYWYALFPEDYRERVYDDDWVERYREEIMAAMGLLDGYLERLIRFVESSGRMLVVVSSMGQCANPELTREYRIQRSVDFRLENVDALIRAIVSRHHQYEVMQAMVPQYTLKFPSDSAARAFADDVADTAATSEGIYLAQDCTDDRVTLTTSPDTRNLSDVKLRGQSYKHEQLGFRRLQIEDHHSGHHHPSGTLLVYNSRTARAAGGQVGYLEYAPAMLDHFGIDRADYMQRPTFTL